MYMNVREYRFHNALGQQLALPEVVSEAIQFMRSVPEYPYKIIIGSDSKIASDLTADFVTAIVVHRVGNGGKYFWRRIDFDGKFYTLRDRIWQEVLFSIELAKAMLTELQTSSAPAYDFEIHVDIGTQGATKALIQEVVGVIRANHFEIKTKPESYAASKVADRHV